MSSRVERLVYYNAPPNGYTVGKVYLWLVLGWPITLSIVMLYGVSLGQGWYRLLWILWSPDTYVYCADLTDMTFILLYLCYLLVLHNFTGYANNFIGLNVLLDDTRYVYMKWFCNMSRTMWLKLTMAFCYICAIWWSSTILLILQMILLGWKVLLEDTLYVYMKWFWNMSKTMWLLSTMAKCWHYSCHILPLM